MLRASTDVDYPYFPFRISVDYVLVSRTDNLSRQYHRSLFEKAAQKEGLIINHELAGPICFTLISTPFNRLCLEAEKLQISFPLKDCPVDPASPSCCGTLSSAFVTEDIVNYICAPFSRRNGQLFLNYENEKLFFTSAQRNMLTHEILTQLDISGEIKEENLSELVVGEESQHSVIADEPLRRKGLQYLRMEDAYEDSFILHEPSKEEPYFKKMKDNSFATYIELINEIETDPRKKMSSLWSRCFRFQPLGLVRQYFGEQIAFYFAWQGTFLTVLWPATVLGVSVFIFGFIKSVRTNPATFGNCTVIDYVDESAIVSCKLRNKLAQVFTTVSSWFMKSFDNELNAFFAAFMSIWGITYAIVENNGTLFCQLWRRNNTVLAYEWDCEDFSKVDPDRPEYQGSTNRTDPLTDQPENVNPQFLRFLKIAVSCIVVTLSMGLVIISLLMVTLYKLWASSSLECNREYTFTCSVVAAYVPSIMNTVSTVILGGIYEWIVMRLTYWENHRTNSDHHNALVIKMFALQLVNNYTSLFYVAFIRPENNGFQTKGLFGLGEEYKDICLPGTCGSLLAVQLISHMIIKPLPKFTKDVVLPFLTRLRNCRKREDEVLQETVNANEMNVLLREWMKPNTGDFTLGEFNEKIILFGTTMMFAALFPLAPLIALVIGLIDIRVDAFRLLWLNRRPVPVMASGIGIWMSILYFLQYAAVITNAFIIAFTSDFCPNFFSDMMYCDVKNRLLIVIVFQNMVLILKYVFQSIIPTVPSFVRVAQRRKRYVVNYVIEKGDVPYKIRNRRRKRNVKLAWMVPLPKHSNAPKLISKVAVETIDESSPSS